MSIDLDIEGMESTTQTQINRFKITEGSHTLRILPPFGKDHANRASREINLHWGFVTSTGQPKPVPCSYKTEGYCPLCERAKELEALAARAKSMGDDEAEKQNLQDSVNIRNRRSFLYNASDKEGKVGVLDVPKSLHDAIIGLFKEYITKYDLDPTSLTDGVWLQITREGKGLKTRYSAKFNKSTHKIDGELIEKLDRTPLADNVVSNYDKLAIDIHSLYKAVPAADLAKILNGAPVDEIIKKAPRDVKGEVPTPRVEVKPSASEAKQPTSVEPVKPVKAVTATPTKPLEDDWDSILNSDE